MSTTGSAENSSKDVKPGTIFTMAASLGISREMYRPFLATTFVIPSLWRHQSFSMASRRMAYYNAAYRQEFSVLDRRELRPPPARLSAGGRAICDPEIVAWLRETVSPKAAAKKVSE